MAGTFYRSPAPGEPPFVRKGDKVTKGQTVAIIEAMKLMNEIEVCSCISHSCDSTALTCPRCHPVLPLLHQPCASGIAVAASWWRPVPDTASLQALWIWRTAMPQTLTSCAGWSMLQADVSGEVVDFIAENGKPVTIGQVTPFCFEHLHAPAMSSR